MILYTKNGNYSIIFEKLKTYGKIVNLLILMTQTAQDQ